MGFLSKVKTLLPLWLTLREYNVIVGQNARDQITQTTGGSRVGVGGLGPLPPLFLALMSRFGDLNWMPKVVPWRLAILAKMAILAKLAILAKIAMHAMAKLAKNHQPLAV